MKLLTFMITLLSLNSALAASVTCESPAYKISIQYSSSSDIRVTLNGETALADGLVNKNEVDLVAKFPSYGEMTIYANVGKNDPSNYIFLNGKRNPVFCR